MQSLFIKRSAGILLHITSLPSPFGIGDLGPEAFAFADFLYQSRQRFWQILPLTPVHRSQAFSPYSSISGMAGNTLLISPEWLMRAGLLKKNMLAAAVIPSSEKVNFEKAIRNKSRLFDIAYRNFKSRKQERFQLFCQREAYWLNDFAGYMVLKTHFNDRPWYQWPAEFKFARQKSLTKFASAQADAINKEKWLQFIFFEQWKALRKYCNERNIHILGDLPFYTSYDSADVWSNPAIFNLKKDGAMAGVAGVPPDYFNKNGQLWGMPVFRWDVLKRQRYGWWINRIRKNLELVDVLRLDHFRAFSGFWEVPAGHTTAKKGKWKTGTGKAFFDVLKKKLGELPFVAEDLGDITPDVYELRDTFGLPGMKVLQFAFGDNMPESDHIPHNFSQNFIVYTGTHDNNTTRGWYRAETKKDQRHRLEQYAGQRVTEKNVHDVMARMAYASIAGTVILPLQDVLGLDERARMNTPASMSGNWAWRLKPGQITRNEEKKLRNWTELYRRNWS